MIATDLLGIEDLERSDIEEILTVLLGVAFDTLVFRTAGDNLRIFADGDRIDVTLVLVDGADLGLSEADLLFL